MNTRQKEFLDELGTLFKKYAIVKMTVGSSVVFESCSEELAVMAYRDGKFRRVEARQAEYTPCEHYRQHYYYERKEAAPCTD